VTLFQATVLFWWLALGAIGQACWCAAWYRAQRCQLWLNAGFIPGTLAFMFFGMFALGFAVCFEPRKEPRR